MSSFRYLHRHTFIFLRLFHDVASANEKDGLSERFGSAKTGLGLEHVQIIHYAKSENAAKPVKPVKVPKDIC